MPGNNCNSISNWYFNIAKLAEGVITKANGFKFYFWYMFFVYR